MGELIRNDHGHLCLVFPILFTEVMDEVPLFEHRGDDYPDGPQDIEQEPIRCQIGVGPDHHQREEIQGMTHPSICALYRHGHGFRFLVTEVAFYLFDTERIK